MDSDNGDRQGYSKGGGEDMNPLLLGLIIGLFIGAVLGVFAIAGVSVNREEKLGEAEIEAYHNHVEQSRDGRS